MTTGPLCCIIEIEVSIFLLFALTLCSVFQNSGRDRTDLDEDGESEVEIEVRREGGGRGGQPVVTHRRHRPVEEHRAGSTEQRNNQWTLQY